MLSSSQAVLINCAYTNLNGSFSQTDCKVLNADDDIFVGGSEMTILDPQTGEPYSGLTNIVYRPFLVSGSNPLKLSDNSPAISGGCETYWDVTLLSGKFIVKIDSTVSKVNTYQNGEAR